MHPEGLTIIESIEKSRNLPYLVADTSGLNFIKIWGIWFFWGQKPLLIERNWKYGNLPYLEANI